ncbi:MAG TPA: hypothetical protein VHN20_02780 [Beijerinckiaceae bacterium]|nr:hypothetical protein [Beijerinckiaceae bacterium]
MAKTHDPRSEAEKARADLIRNAEMGSATMEAPFMRQPSVTPDTFGEHAEKARRLSGTDQGLEAGGPKPKTSGKPPASQSIVEAEQVADGRDESEPVANQRG